MSARYEVMLRRVVELFDLCLLLCLRFRERVLLLLFELVLLFSFELTLVVMWVENATPFAFWPLPPVGLAGLGGGVCIS